LFVSAGAFLSLLFDPEDGSNIFPETELPSNYTVLHLKYVAFYIHIITV
jgi:hypothetical protein